jgi:hypothetical protein
MIDHGLRLRPYGFPHHAVPSRFIKTIDEDPRPGRYFKNAQAFKKLGRHVARRELKHEMIKQLYEYEYRTND